MTGDDKPSRATLSSKPLLFERIVSAAAVAVLAVPLSLLAVVLIDDSWFVWIGANWGVWLALVLAGGAVAGFLIPAIGRLVYWLLVGLSGGS